ncbi:hypothetical protein AXE80_10070 [Wenyingzhuangia fucanilytica]|uniref:Glycoside hydrolase family 5 domain-containing protein n=1 Tax=Wenyingzhuangia fucanilytica TaxID=1790137 RepID=A0A1B1Y759_9FLAO|nr:cellulase family glycosylhydrolase [Wenyingzhuangia fucanilytica]ANW96600.1 hypothetical protein AXE80_10070 [Wenyingzhuangia fucanilytica]
MNILKHFYIVLILLNISFAKAQHNTNIGVNVTGLERFWENETYHYKDIIKDIDELYYLGVKDIRLPISFEYQFNKKSKRRFLKDLIKIVKHVKKKNMTIIICYFDHTLDKTTNYNNLNTIKDNWKYISHKLKKHSNYIYYEIVNEPNLYPIQWDEMVREIVPVIRKEDNKTKILIGATNYNSIYELSRKTPFPYDNLIYVFHFYEPFLFTHQGANWIGNQTKTTGIPYPYDSIKMPKIDLNTLGTAGEINYNDYKHMANKISLSHKINIITKWAQENNVELWCTEFGAISSIPQKDRCNYFNDLVSVFRKNNIKCYLWEYKGNFGIYNKNLINCF